MALLFWAITVSFQELDVSGRQALPLASPSPYVPLNLLGSSASPEGPLDLNGKGVTLCCQTNTGFLDVLSIFKPFLLLLEVFVLSQAGGAGWAVVEDPLDPGTGRAPA